MFLKVVIETFFLFSTTFRGWLNFFNISIGGDILINRRGNVLFFLHLLDSLVFWVEDITEVKWGRIAVIGRETTICHDVNIIKELILVR